MDDAVQAGVNALAERFSDPVRIIGEPRVRHRDRLVFDAEVGSERYIVKVDTDVQRHRTEVLGIQLASGTVPVPELSLARAESPSVLAYPYVDGVWLGAVDSEEAWRNAGVALARLHDRGWSCPPEHRRHWAARQLETGREACARLTGVIPAELLRQTEVVMAAAFTGMQLDRCVPLHGDCHDDHILIGANNEVVAFLDFGDFGCGDPLTDLVTVTIDHPDQFPALLAGYQPSGEVRARLAASERGYRVRRRIGCISWRSELGLSYQQDLAGLGELLAADRFTVVDA